MSRLVRPSPTMSSTSLSNSVSRENRDTTSTTNAGIHHCDQPCHWRQSAELFMVIRRANFVFLAMGNPLADKRHRPKRDARAVDAALKMSCAPSGRPIRSAFATCDNNNSAALVSSKFAGPRDCRNWKAKRSICQLSLLNSAPDL